MSMKKFAFVFVLMFLVPFIMVGCGVEEVQLSSYALDLEYNDSQKTLKGNEVVSYVNTSDNMFSYLYFHLYPNAFGEGREASVVSSASMDKAYPNGVSYGNIAINGVLSGGEELQYEILGEQLNILKVNLKDGLYPDDIIEINILFEVKLANINHRLGYGENTINFGNFYPIACVYEDGKGFVTSPYSSNGDPFYSDVANYDVKISYSSELKLASSGKVLKTSSEGGVTTSYIEGKKIRDFCFILSDKFTVESGEVDGVTVNYYHYNDADYARNLQVACDAVETFNNMFGKYPYEVLNIVEANFLNGGMEYPNLVMISDTCRDGEEYGYVIVHEIAHQWWYGVVGNDEYNHAWQDEGLTEYSTLLFYRENSEYGFDFDELVESANSSYKLFLQVYNSVNGSVDESMDRSLAEFDTEPEYVQCTYTKGVLMFDTLREMVGDKKFGKALKDYYQNYAYKNASPADMIASFERSTGYQLEGFFKAWLDGEVKIL